MTVWDYSRWRHAEWDRFGQGREESQSWAPAGKLSGPYTQPLARIRIKYPQGWDVVENASLKQKTARLGPDATEVVRFNHPFGQATIRVVTEEFTGDPPQLIDRLATGETKDREYINSDYASLTIITREGDKLVKQVAVATKRGRMMRIEVEVRSPVWGEFARTVEEVYRSLVWY